MKDEIKEILNKLLLYFKESNINDFGYEEDKLISYEEAQILLNYITNLQEEYERLEKVIISIYKELESLYNHLTKKDLNYESRIDKAVAIIQNDTTLNSQRQRERLINTLTGGDE